jgi:hypothetical protein
MTRISYLLPALLLTVGAHAWAQTPPSDKPPKMDKIEEYADDAVNIKSNQSQQGTQITDTRDNNGNLVDTTVKSGASTYKVRPAHPAGSVAAEGPGPAIRGPQWTLFEFGNKKKTTEEDDDAAAEVPAPPVPAPAPAK